MHHLTVESAAFFVPSTSFCSLTSWFTSSCPHHLITVPRLHCHHLSFPRPFTPDLKLISFTTPFLHSLSDSFWTALTDLGLGPEVGTGVCLFYFLYFCLWLCVLDSTIWPQSAFQSTLNSSTLSYRVLFLWFSYKCTGRIRITKSLKWTKMSTMLACTCSYRSCICLPWCSTSCYVNV